MTAERLSGRPLICLVTDRRRLCGALSRAPEDWAGLLTDQLAGALAGGIDLVQVREPDLDARALSDFIRQVIRQIPGAASRLVVNDRLDVALTGGAAGVHLPERSMSPVDARLLAPAPFLIGRSVHGPGATESSRGASYLIAGTVLASASKPSETHLLGWAGLRAVVEAGGGTPVLGIGGLTLAHVTNLTSAGAAGLASIGWFQPSQADGLAEFVQKRVTELRLAFDSVRADYLR